MSLFQTCHQNNYAHVTMEMARKMATFVAMAKFRLRNREDEEQQLKIKVIVLVEEETEKPKALASGSPCKHSKT